MNYSFYGQHKTLSDGKGSSMLSLESIGSATQLSIECNYTEQKRAHFL